MLLGLEMPWRCRFVLAQLSINCMHMIEHKWWATSSHLADTPPLRWIRWRCLWRLRRLYHVSVNSKYHSHNVDVEISSNSSFPSAITCHTRIYITWKFITTHPYIINVLKWYSWNILVRFTLDGKWFSFTSICSLLSYDWGNNLPISLFPHEDNVSWAMPLRKLTQSLHVTISQMFNIQ